MAAYSLRRVAQYARYHYTSQRRNYLSVMLTCVAFPVLFGILSREISAVEGISTAIYFFGGIGFAVRTTFAMRNRGTKVMECTLPLSNEERMTFMVLNLAVMFPLFMTVAANISLLIAAPFNYYEVDVWAMMLEITRRFLFSWDLYVVIQMFAAVSLFLNIVARRNLFVAYLGAFIGIMVFLGTVARIGANFLVDIDPRYFESIEINENVARVIFALIPVVFYALCYWALRRRQMRW